MCLPPCGLDIDPTGQRRALLTRSSFYSSFEVCYNPRWLHPAIGYQSPAKMEDRLLAA